MVAVARCNGTILVDDDGKLGIVERGGGWLNTAIFLAVLLSLGPGITAMSLIAGGQPGGGVLLGLAAVSILAAVLLIRHKVRDNARTSHPPPWLVFDVPAGVVRDHTGAVLGPVAQVRLVREGQLASSSYALVAYLPAKHVIARGSPFGNSVRDLEHALRSRGVDRR